MAGANNVITKISTHILDNYFPIKQGPPNFYS